MKPSITKYQILLIAEVLFCFSGITFLLAELVLRSRFLMVSDGRPFEYLAFPVIATGFCGLIAVFSLAHEVIFSSAARLVHLTRFFVYLGIATALLPALVGLFSGHLLLIFIGWCPIICASHLIHLSKKTSPSVSSDTLDQPMKSVSSAGFSMRNSCAFLSQFVLFLCAAPALFLALWLLARESAVLWYGHSLQSKAGERAGNIAAGEQYCLISSNGANTFAELDVRRIISTAFDRHFGYSSFVWGASMRAPHFGIKIEETSAQYFWSFEADNFVAFPGYAAKLICEKDRQPSIFGVGV